VSAAGTAELLAKVLADALSPLQRRLSAGEVDEFFAELGLRFTPSVTTPPGVLGALQVAGDAAQALGNEGDALAAAIGAGDVAQIVARGVTTLNDLVKLTQSLGNASQQLKASSAAFPTMSPGDVSTFADALPLSVFDLALVSKLEAIAPELVNALALAGIVDRHAEPGTAGDPTKPPYEVRKLRLDRVANFFRSPADYLRTLYGWGSVGFDGKFLLAQLAEMAVFAGLPSILAPKPDGSLGLDLLFLEVAVDRSVNPPGLGATISIPLKSDFSSQTPPSELGWSLSVALTGNLGGATGAVLQPPDHFLLFAPAQVQGGIHLEFSTVKNQPGLTLLGVAGGTGLTATAITLDVLLDFAWNGVSGRATSAPGISAKLESGIFVVDLSDGDSFITSLASGGKLEADFGLKLNWSLTTGFQIEGSSAVEIALPVHVTIGTVDLSTLYLRLKVAEDGSLPIELLAGFQGSLGPLTASVDEIGVVLTISFPGQAGNLGPLNISPVFKPPTGVGLSIDAAVVSGGGFLSIDTARGQYAGILQLTIADFLNVTAIGLIETKLPDGSNGFSLLIIITADFGEGIQLGFGFALLAVGGLIGLNRGMLFQPLMDGVRTNAISSVLFPQDVIANATRIISDLQAIFPPVQGTFLIGPMAKIGWGVPTLASVSLGVIIEIPPGDIAILGVIRIALPADDVAILVLQVNFAGAIEVDKQRIYFFAALFDSHVLFITLDGSMGLLVAYGSDANFVVSVGGFHPLFTPPPLPFPPLQRISMNLINESFARIHADGYFAVTSNTVQFGTQSNYFFGFSALNVQGASSFDALIQFSPFHFTVSFSTSFSVNIFGVGAFGIDIALTVSGPTPFHASGTASISFFFFSVGINIDFTWGDSRDTTLPPVSVMPLLTAELVKQSNWRALLPPGNTLLVTVRRLDPANAAQVLHPAGVLQFSQRVVPLDLTLAKFGNQTPSDADLFTMDVTSPDLTRTRNLQEPFAPAQFQNFDDAQKLSQPAYVPLDSGMELAVGGVALASGTAITRNVRYDLTIIDTKLRRVFVRFFLFSATLFGYFLNGGSVTRSPLSAYRKALRQPLPGSVTLSPETFAVALTSTNVVFHPEAASFMSQAAAGEFLARAVANDPTLAGTLHVLPRFEVAA